MVLRRCRDAATTESWQRNGRRMKKWRELSSAPSPDSSAGLIYLYVVIHEELVGMRAQADGVVFLPLGADPHFDEVFGEDVALEQEGVVLLQAIERLAQAAGHVWNFLQFLGRQFVNVFVERFARLDFVLDAVQARHEQRGEAEIRIRRRVRRAVFEAFGLRIIAVSRNTDGGAAVARAVSQIDRRFVTRHEAFVTVRGGVANGAQGLGVFEQTAGVVKRHLAQSAVLLPGEKKGLPS